MEVFSNLYNLLFRFLETQKFVWENNNNLLAHFLVKSRHRHAVKLDVWWIQAECHGGPFSETQEDIFVLIFREDQGQLLHKDWCSSGLKL